MQHFRRQVGFALGAALALAGCSGKGGEPVTEPLTATATASAEVTILAVGDVAQCGSRPAAETAAALTAALVEQQGPGLPLLLLGDLVYDTGTMAEYHNCYQPTYGRFMARSYPAPGNHDYGVPGGQDYYRYFGERAGPQGRGYYSFDLGGWHLVSLNSNISMAKGSPQELWLRADLAANQNKKNARWPIGTTHAFLRPPHMATTCVRPMSGKHCMNSRLT